MKNKGSSQRLWLKFQLLYFSYVALGKLFNFFSLSFLILKQ